MKLTRFKLYLPTLFIALLFVGTMSFSAVSTPRAAAIDILTPACDHPNASTPTANSGVCKDKQNGKNAIGSIDDPVFGKSGILAIALNVLSYIGGLIAVFTIIISGIEMVTSGGDSNKVKEKQRAIMYALGGLVIVVLAQVIVRFVLGRVVV